MAAVFSGGHVLYKDTADAASLGKCELPIAIEAESMQTDVSEPYSDRDGTQRYTWDEIVHNLKDLF